MCDEALGNCAGITARVPSATRTGSSRREWRRRIPQGLPRCCSMGGGCVQTSTARMYVSCSSCHAVRVLTRLASFARCDACAMLATYSMRSTVVCSSRSAGSTVGLPSAMVVLCNLIVFNPGVWWNRVFGSGELNDKYSASLNTVTWASGTDTRPRSSRGVQAKLHTRYRAVSAAVQSFQVRQGVKQAFRKRLDVRL